MLSLNPDHRRHQRVVTKRDLDDRYQPGVLLVCLGCGEENSADPADYWDVRPDTVFLCGCGEAMQLARKRTGWEGV